VGWNRPNSAFSEGCAILLSFPFPGLAELLACEEPVRTHQLPTFRRRGSARINPSGYAGLNSPAEMTTRPKGKARYRGAC
jgi:hypothetical protein